MISLYSEKAAVALEASELETLDAYTRVNRAYYCIFYCAVALLLTKNIEKDSHKGILSAFGKEFMKTDELPRELGEYARKLEEMRYIADYEPRTKITKEMADCASNMACFFYKETIQKIS
jgi:uncharacterized protein (UPF0332 family)